MQDRSPSPCYIIYNRQTGDWTSNRRTTAGVLSAVNVGGRRETRTCVQRCGWQDQWIMSPAAQSYAGLSSLQRHVQSIYDISRRHPALESVESGLASCSKMTRLVLNSWLRRGRPGRAACRERKQINRAAAAAAAKQRRMSTGSDFDKEHQLIKTAPADCMAAISPCRPD